MIELKFNISNLTESEKKALQDKKDQSNKDKEEYLQKRGQVWSKQECDARVKEVEKIERKRLNDTIEYNKDITELKVNAMSNCDKIQNPSYKGNKNDNIEEDETKSKESKLKNNNLFNLNKLLGKSLKEVSLKEVNEYFDKRGLKRKTISHRYFWWETYTTTEFTSVTE